MSSELKKAFNTYIKQIEQDHRKGNDTEMTHRDAFTAYVKAVLPNGYTISQETRQEGGNKPDYEIENESRTVGYIETKKIDYSLERLESDDQLHRYFEAVGNVVITNSTKIIDVTGNEPVEIKGRVPARSVVIPGSYTKKFNAGEFNVSCALIIGKRKASTDLKTSLNEALRDYDVVV